MYCEWVSGYCDSVVESAKEDGLDVCCFGAKCYDVVSGCSVCVYCAASR